MIREAHVRILVEGITNIVSYASALSTCGSVLLCSIVYYPRDGFYVLSVQCGLNSVQIKCCSIYGGQEQHGRACCEA